MAKGKNCPQCGFVMYAIREEKKDKCLIVYYQCCNGGCKFEERVEE